MVLSTKYENHAIYQNDYLNEIAKEFGNGNGLNKAYKVTFTILVALRNRLDFEHAISFFNRLPLPFQAIFAKDWKIEERVPYQIQNLNDLLLEIVEADKVHYQVGLTDKNQALYALQLVFKAMSRYTSKKENEAIYQLLPKDVSANLQLQEKNVYGESPDPCIWYS